MSYDVCLVIDTGGESPAYVCEWRNYTWNCSPMFRLALGGEGINDLHGKIAGEMIEPLAAAVQHMEDPANLATYEAMNPPNGWGQHSTATRFLRNILADCRAHPKATIDVS